MATANNKLRKHVAHHSENEMKTFGLGEWIDQEFGVRDERLWTDEPGPDELDRLLATQERRYETERRRLESLDREFEDIVSTDVSKDRKDRQKAKTEANREKHENVAERVHRHGIRVTAIVAIDALRGVGDEEIDSEALEQRLRARTETTVVDETYLREYRTVVAKALDVGTESLPWSCPDPGELTAPFDVAAESA